MKHETDREPMFGATKGGLEMTIEKLKDENERLKKTIEGLTEVNKERHIEIAELKRELEEAEEDCEEKSEWEIGYDCAWDDIMDEIEDTIREIVITSAVAMRDKLKATWSDSVTD